KSQPTVRNSGAGKTRFSYKSVRTGCRLRSSHRFSAGNPSGRSLHRQNFPYAVSIDPYHIRGSGTKNITMTGPRHTKGILGSAFLWGARPGIAAGNAPVIANLQMQDPIFSLEFFW